jgi:AraC family transcriptional regulator
MQRTVLQEAFKRLTGMTVHKFLVNRRLEVAKNLLMQTSEKTTQVASEVGYRSYAAFCCHFKEMTGKTPGDYRRPSGG